MVCASEGRAEIAPMHHAGTLTIEASGTSAAMNRVKIRCGMRPWRSRANFAIGAGRMT